MSLDGGREGIRTELEQAEWLGWRGSEDREGKGLGWMRDGMWTVGSGRGGEERALGAYKARVMNNGVYVAVGHNSCPFQSKHKLSPCSNT
jgi:hypothetical protein